MFAFSADLSEFKYAAMSLKTTVRLVSGKMKSETPVPMPNPVKKASSSLLTNASACTTARYKLDMLLLNKKWNGRVLSHMFKVLRVTISMALCPFVLIQMDRIARA
jgi:hypothetical protein